MLMTSRVRRQVNLIVRDRRLPLEATRAAEVLDSGAEGHRSSQNGEPAFCLFIRVRNSGKILT